MSRPFRRLSPERQSARVRLGASLGHMWRISADCDEWANIYVAIRTNERLARFAGPDLGFNDPDMLLGSDPRVAASLSPQHSRTQFAMWAVMAAPLLLGARLEGGMSAWDLETYSNEEVIAIDQDPLGVQGAPIVSTCPEYEPLDNWWCSPWSMPHDVVLVWTSFLGWAGTAAVGAAGLALVFTARHTAAALALYATACFAYSRVLVAYRPAVDACQQIWAKPLSDGSVALAFVNFAPHAVELVCDAACLAAAGLAAGPLKVRDATRGTDAAAHAGALRATLSADGDARLFRVSPF